LLDLRSSRPKILAIERRVPLPSPYFWLAVLQSLGEPVDWSLAAPRDTGIT